MIHVYGQGKPGDLGRPIFHHARGVRDVALAVLAGLWVHELHTDQSDITRCMSAREQTA